MTCLLIFLLPCITDEVLWVQGEYVCVSQLEATYTAGSQAIAQMFIYGNSLREYLLAVVVPTAGAPLYC